MKQELGNGSFLTDEDRAKNIDLDWHIKQKMKYNELRPYHHGGKKY